MDIKVETVHTYTIGGKYIDLSLADNDRLQLRQWLDQFSSQTKRYILYQRRHKVGISGPGVRLTGR